MGGSKRTWEQVHTPIALDLGWIGHQLHDTRLALYDQMGRWRDLDVLNRLSRSFFSQQAGSTRIDNGMKLQELYFGEYLDNPQQLVTSISLSPELSGLLFFFFPLTIFSSWKTSTIVQRSVVSYEYPVCPCGPNYAILNPAILIESRQFRYRPHCAQNIFAHRVEVHSIR